MAGPAITRALAKREYGEFYRLVHDYSERHLLPPLTAVTSGCALLERMGGQTPPPRPLGDPAVLDAVRAISGLRMVERARGYLWPGADENQDFEAANRERWAPYDGEAWDVFFGGLRETLLPPLEACLVQSQQTQILMGLGLGINPAGSDVQLVEIPILMVKGCRKARAVLKASHYEAVVAAWLDRRGDN